MTDEKPVIEVRARAKRATLAAIIDEQDRQARDLHRVSRAVEGEIIDRLSELGRKLDELALLGHRLEALEGELSKIVGMVGTIRAINNRADQTLSLVQLHLGDSTSQDGEADG
jgi:hypothetical protein